MLLFCQRFTIFTKVKQTLLMETRRDDILDFIIVGAGMIGASTAKYVSKCSDNARVAVIGVTEGDNVQSIINHKITLSLEVREMNPVYSEPGMMRLE